MQSSSDNRLIFGHYRAEFSEKKLLGRQHILLVEGNRADAEFIEDALLEIESGAFFVEKVYSLEKAMISLGRSRIDLILLDLYLEDSRGLQTLREINAVFPEIPVLVITDSNDQLVASQALQGGAQDYLLKEKINPGLLANAIYYGLRRKQVENNLRSSEQNFQRVLENSADAMMIFDTDGFVHYANEAARKMFIPKTIRLEGSTLGMDLLNWKDAEIIINDDKDNYLVAEMRMVDLDWQGQAAYLASLRDISVRKKREQKLREHENFLLQIIEGSSIATLVINKKHQITYWNKACEILTGKHPEEMLGTKDQWKAFYGAQRPVLADLVADEMPESEILRFYGNKARKSPLIEGAYEATDYIPLTSSDGKWLFFTAAPLRDQSGKIVGAIETLQDVTAQKRAERKLQRRTADLRRTIEQLRKANRKIIEQQKALVEEERLKVILQIAGAAAHDLKQPLTVLLGNIDLLRAVLDNPHSLEEYISEIEEAGLRITKILNRFGTIPIVDSAELADNTMLKKLPRSIKILYVEDNDRDFERVAEILALSGNVTINRAESLTLAKEIIQKENYDVVLLDYLLPDGSGMELMESMRNTGVETPVIVITGQGDEMIASRIIQAGAYDYLPKVAIGNGEILLQSLLSSLERSHIRLELKRTQDMLVKMSTRDSLTGLYNRRFLIEALDREYERMLKFNSSLTFCLIDLDDFKLVNDTYGHQTGDMVLSEIGKILKSSFRRNDLLARFGGEEFAVILAGMNTDEAILICDRFREKVASHEFTWEDHKFSITASMGLAGPDCIGCKSGQDLIAMADKALYKSKGIGKNKVSVFTPDNTGQNQSSQSGQRVITGH